MDMIFGNPIRETFRNQIGLPGNKNIGINKRWIIKMNANIVKKHLKKRLI